MRIKYKIKCAAGNRVAVVDIRTLHDDGRIAQSVMEKTKLLLNTKIMNIMSTKLIRIYRQTKLTYTFNDGNK